MHAKLRRPIFRTVTIVTVSSTAAAGVVYQRSLEVEPVRGPAPDTAPPCHHGRVDRRPRPPARHDRSTIDGRCSDRSRRRILPALQASMNSLAAVRSPPPTTSAPLPMVSTSCRSYPMSDELIVNAHDQAAAEAALFGTLRRQRVRAVTPYRDNQDRTGTGLFRTTAAGNLDPDKSFMQRSRTSTDLEIEGWTAHQPEPRLLSVPGVALPSLWQADLRAGDYPSTAAIVGGDGQRIAVFDSLYPTTQPPSSRRRLGFPLGRRTNPVEYPPNPPCPVPARLAMDHSWRC